MNIRLIGELIGGRPVRESGKYRKNEIGKSPGVGNEDGRGVRSRPIIEQ